jgi:phage shock protein A
MSNQRRNKAYENKGYQMAEESVESLRAQVRALEERVSKLEEDVKSENLAAAVARRQRDLGV